MTVETATYIDGLNASNPGSSDLKAEGDDHLRLLKSTIKATFPNIAGAVTPTHTVINNLAAGTFPTVALTGITTIATSGDMSVAGLPLAYRGYPAASITTGTPIAADDGKCIYATGGVTIPNSVLTGGNTLNIANNTGSPITITASISSLFLAGTATTGNRTLAGHGFATVIFLSATSAIIRGDGLT